jgi:hypothetical protein
VLLKKQSVILSIGEESSNTYGVVRSIGTNGYFGLCPQYDDKNDVLANT